MNQEKSGLLLITNGFPYGESERSFLHAEFPRLCDNFRVHIISLGKDEPLIYPLPGGVTAERYAYSSLRNAKLPGRLLKLCGKPVLRELSRAKKDCSASLFRNRLRTILYTYLTACAAADDLAMVIEQKRIGTIYTYWCTTMTLAAAMLKKRFPHLKVVTRFHGYDLYQERSSIGWQPFRPYIAEHIDRLIFACETAKQYFLDTWGRQYSDRSVVSYLGCSEKQLVTPVNDGILKLVSCSNLIPLKRVNLIIEALSLLPKTMQVCWHHLGDGPEMEALQNQAHTLLDSMENIQWKFWGFRPNDELEDIYASIRPDVFITTSSTEGLPVTVQEAFCMGIPAIGTSVGGIPELIIHNKTGILLPAEPSAEEVSAAIRTYFDIPFPERLSLAASALELRRAKLNADDNASQLSFLLQSL